MEKIGNQVKINNAWVSVSFSKVRNCKMNGDDHEMKVFSNLFLKALKESYIVLVIIRLERIKQALQFTRTRYMKVLNMVKQYF